VNEHPGGDDGALPTFLVIGAMKSGTSSLHRYLEAHPEVFMASPKEPRYFAEGGDANYHRGIEWYRALFAAGARMPARGEASTHYTKAPQFSRVPERIAHVIPDVRLVYVLRDPIDRIRSQYAFLVRRGNEQRPIEQAVIEDPRYVDWSKYAFQLEQYHEHFDRSQILVVWSDDLEHRRPETFSRVLSFIGVDPDVARVRKVLAKEFHTMDARREPTRLHAPARRVAAYTPLRFLPSDLKLRMSRMGRVRGKPVDIALSPRVEARLWAQIVDDNRRLEALVGEAPPWMARRDSSPTLAPD
jgi:Sulfotransferase domain